MVITIAVPPLFVTFFVLAVLHSWRIPRRETADGGSLPFLPGRRWPFDPQKERKGKGGEEKKEGEIEREN